MAGGKMKDIGYGSYQDLYDLAANTGLCCKNCYATGPLRDGYCIPCLHECHQCECAEKTGEDHGWKRI